MHIYDIANAYIHHHEALTYLILLFFIVVEGEVTLVITGIFAHLHLLPLPVALMLATFGAAIKTLAGYGIGMALKRYIPENKVFDFIEKRVRMVFPHFSEKPFWSLFFSKFIYGLNHFTIIFAGYIATPWKRYLQAEVISSIVWVIVMFSIGYFFSYAAFGLSHDLRKVAVYILIGIIGFLILQKIVGFVIEFIEAEES
jgi:membrane protein DedA with SNARE-associated domain